MHQFIRQDSLVPVEPPVLRTFLYELMDFDHASILCGHLPHGKGHRTADWPIITKIIHCGTHVTITRTADINAVTLAWFANVGTHLLSWRLVYIVSSATATPKNAADTPPSSSRVSGDSLVWPLTTSFKSMAKLPA